MVVYLFWISAVILLYTYLGYPLLLLLMSRLKGRDVEKREISPAVSFIISVSNGERIIRAKIENTLAVEYPREKLQVIVASDCSTDKTDGIVSEYKNAGVELVSLPQRVGKTAAQNRAIREAAGEILVFTDSSALVGRESLRPIVRNFSDRSVGCVTSEDRDSDSETRGGESLYVRYGTFLRRLEGRVGSLVGASGSYYAVRRSLAEQLSPGFARDFASSLIARKAGLRTVNESTAWSYVQNVGSVDREFRRKLRTIVRGLTVIFGMRELLNPFVYGFYSLQLVSQKLLKWLAPFFFITMVASCAQRSDMMLCRLVIVAAAIFCALAITGALAGRFATRHRWLSIPAYVGVGVLAVLAGWIVYLSGGRRASWEPTRRSDAGKEERDRHGETL